jgi:hypothetical protein
MDCTIGPSIKKQVKTSRNIFLNWLYKKLYGYTKETVQEIPVVVIPSKNKIIFKDEETFNKAKDCVTLTASLEVF